MILEIILRNGLKSGTDITEGLSVGQQHLCCVERGLERDKMKMEITCHRNVSNMMVVASPRCQ